MKFYQRNQNAVILKILKIANNCHGRFTANYPKFLLSHLIHRKFDTILHPLFKDMRDLSPMLTIYVHFFLEKPVVVLILGKFSSLFVPTILLVLTL